MWVSSSSYGWQWFGASSPACINSAALESPSDAAPLWVRPFRKIKEECAALCSVLYPADVTARWAQRCLVGKALCPTPISTGRSLVICPPWSGSRMAAWSPCSGPFRPGLWWLDHWGLLNRSLSDSCPEATLPLVTLPTQLPGSQEHIPLQHGEMEGLKEHSSFI